MDMLESSADDRGSNKCKGLEKSREWEFSRNSKETSSMNEAESSWERVV